MISRLVLNDTTSSRQRYVWVEACHSWKSYASVPHDYCDTYGLCGAFGICVIRNSPGCQCLEGFKPKQAQNWNSMDWSHGCEHNEPLDWNCPTLRTHGSWLDTNMNLREYRKACLKNRSCKAYSNSDISGQGTGCALWFGDSFLMVDRISIIYIRIPASNRGNNSLGIVVVIVAPIASICGVLLVIWYLSGERWRPKAKMRQRAATLHLKQRIWTYPY